MTKTKTETKNQTKTKTHTEVFSKIYSNRIWAPKETTPLSGAGSSLSYNQKYMNFLQTFIDEPSHQIQTIADLGCGDWTFSQELDFGNKQYLGMDCVSSVIETNQQKFARNNIEFQRGDFSKISTLQTIQDRDLVILKDVLQHWDDTDVIRVLDFLTAQDNIKYILLVHGKRKQDDFDKKRSVNNYYHYSNLNFKSPPLDKYNIEHLFDYKFKEVGLITLKN